MTGNGQKSALDQHGYSETGGGTLAHVPAMVAGNVPALSSMVADQANGLTALCTAALNRAADESEHDGAPGPRRTLALRRREGKSGARVR